MAKNFKLLQKRMTGAARARSEAKADRLTKEMGLNELRAALSLTQEHLAAKLHMKQSAISKVERRTDMYISTLRKLIEAMGGDLEILAILPNKGVIRIAQFSKLKRHSRRRHFDRQATPAL